MSEQFLLERSHYPEAWVDKMLLRWPKFKIQNAHYKSNANLIHEYLVNFQ